LTQGKGNIIHGSNHAAARIKVGPQIFDLEKNHQSGVQELQEFRSYRIGRLPRRSRVFTVLYRLQKAASLSFNPSVL
jgi:hypothetical protein